MSGPSLIEHFAALEDPRQSWKVLFPLPEVLLLVPCGTLAGAEDFVEIRRWGQMHIGVKLAAHRIVDIRLSFASGMAEAAMHVGGGLQEVIESDAADDGDEQHTSGDVPHAPERRGVDSVEQVLRGKKPGIPGRGRRTTRLG